MMEVLLLGTGTLRPQPETASSGLAVLVENAVLPIDLGRNVLSRMVECGLDPLGLDQVLLTHLHPDHSCELVSLLFALNYASDRPREDPFRLVGPTGLRALVAGLVDAWRWLEPRYPLELEELLPEADGQELAGPAGMEIRAVPMHHGDTPALGYRLRAVEGGASMAFTGDTGPGPALRALARDVDLLVAECSWEGPREPAVHLWPEALGRAASEAGCGRLLVTHRYPDTLAPSVLEGIRQHFGGPVQIGHDRLRVRV